LHSNFGRVAQQPNALTELRPFREAQPDFDRQIHSETFKNGQKEAKKSPAQWPGFFTSK